MFLNFNNVIKMRIFKGNPELATQYESRLMELVDELVSQLTKIDK